ncbi:MAG: hypothetical protein PHX78_09950 [bacterium]|nr:hypothetical protein [bacterium]
MNSAIFCITFICLFNPISILSSELNDKNKYSEEAQIYSTFLDFYYDSGMYYDPKLIIKSIAVNDSTSIKSLGWSEKDKSRFYELLIRIAFKNNNPDIDTIDNFWETNRNNVKIIKEIPSKFNLIYLSEADQKEWYIKYPEAVGIISFSQVGFNKGRSQAFLYFVNDINWGAGYIALLNKKDNVWKPGAENLIELLAGKIDSVIIDRMNYGGCRKNIQGPRVER